MYIHHYCFVYVFLLVSLFNHYCTMAWDLHIQVFVLFENIYIDDSSIHHWLIHCWLAWLLLFCKESVATYDILSNAISNLPKWLWCACNFWYCCLPILLLLFLLQWEKYLLFYLLIGSFCLFLFFSCVNECSFLPQLMSHVRRVVKL